MGEIRRLVEELRRYVPSDGMVTDETLADLVGVVGLRIVQDAPPRWVRWFVMGDALMLRPSLRERERRWEIGRAIGAAFLREGGYVDLVARGRRFDRMTNEFAARLFLGWPGFLCGGARTDRVASEAIVPEVHVEEWLPILVAERSPVRRDGWACLLGSAWPDALAGA
jgi:hypothetical protein